MQITAILGWLRQRRLPFISFITGFSLLTFELAAARILAPSIGSSTYIWTGVIGVIIAALSLGFLAGGKVADSHNRASDVVVLLLLAAGAAALTLISYELVLDAIVEGFDDPRIQAVVSAFWLFAPASFFIGMTSPYLAKLKVDSLKSTGSAIASLDAYNALGGISGTFVTGFILFGFIGSHEAVGLVVVLLLAASWLLMPRWLSLRRTVVTGMLLLVALTPASTYSSVIKIDTASAHYEVINGFIDDQAVTGLVTGPTGTQSAVYQNGDTSPVFWYNQEIARLTLERYPSSILILGGGAFTLPEYLASELPNASIDVVEIDPELETISRQYFGYSNPSNVTEIFTDARTYLNQTTKKYDVIVVDVYGDTTIPFTFMTKEYGQVVASRLHSDGAVYANIIGGLSGPCRNTFAAVDAAYRPHLPYAAYSTESGRAIARGNYVVAYTRTPQPLNGLTILPKFNQVPYTDNYAPAERLYFECREAQRL